MPTKRDRRRKEYLLASCGHDLLEIGEEVARVAASLDTPSGLHSVLAKAVADPWDRAVVRILLEAPQPFGELLRVAQGATLHAAHRIRLEPALGAFGAAWLGGSAASITTRGGSGIEAPVLML